MYRCVKAICSCMAGSFGPIHMSVVITMPPPSSSFLPFCRMVMVMTDSWQS